MSDLIREVSDSRYAVRLLAARPELAAEIGDPAPFTRAEMLAALQGSNQDNGQDDAALTRRLRRARGNACCCGSWPATLGGRASLEEVCGTMSDLAESASPQRSPSRSSSSSPWASSAAASSTCPPTSTSCSCTREGWKRRAATRKRAAGSFASSRASPRTATCSASTCAFGPTATPGRSPAASTFSTYFVTQGREWERYAWIKARALTGESSRQKELERLVRPFVFRKYLDYATLGRHAPAARRGAPRVRGASSPTT